MHIGAIRNLKEALVVGMGICLPVGVLVKTRNIVMPIIVGVLIRVTVG